ncbi:hypothetical protein BDZ91DRAFT_709012 [Kalaharituber pfeilii]|nr:hypothetical protein BDZ91DRAFT_709012 [Kalaharituber pfeilii]
MYGGIGRQEPLNARQMWRASNGGDIVRGALSHMQGRLNLRIRIRHNIQSDDIRSEVRSGTKQNQSQPEELDKAMASSR